MDNSKIIFIATLILIFVLSTGPMSLNAFEIEPSPKVIEPNEIVETPKTMTEEEINELFGEDPYLGQTSYLQSPKGFSQRGE